MNHEPRLFQRYFLNHENCELPAIFATAVARVKNAIESDLGRGARERIARSENGIRDHENAVTFFRGDPRNTWRARVTYGGDGR